MKNKKRWLLILSAVFLMFSCANGNSSNMASSKGKQAAREFMKVYKSGSGPEIKDALLKYGDSLHGQDLLDFYEELEKQGIYL